MDALDRETKELKETREHARRLRIALREEIAKGYVSIETEGVKIIIHIMEKASFESGFADIREEFRPVLTKISHLLGDNDGSVTVSGHTDNVPISNQRFRSNWELSTSRAVSVAHELLAGPAIDPVRVMVAGHADTRPLTSNDNFADRARNRRVEISIVRGAELDKRRRISLSEPETLELLSQDNTS